MGEHSKWFWRMSPDDRDQLWDDLDTIRVGNLLRQAVDKDPLLFPCLEFMVTMDEVVSMRSHAVQ